jgi:serine/threonine protein kinase
MDIFYRDLKPENVLFGSDGYIRLADFNQSRLNIKGINTMGRSTTGTQNYQSPEIIQN